MILLYRGNNMYEEIEDKWYFVIFLLEKMGLIFILKVLVGIKYINVCKYIL